VNHRRIIGLLGMVVLVGMLAAPTLAATPGSGLVRIQLTFVAGGWDETFVASGPGICTSGTADEQDPWFFSFEDGFRVRMSKRLICDDGSGWFRIVLSAGQTGEGQTSGGWAIVEGSGDYANAVGGGTITATSRNPDDGLGVDTMTGMLYR